MLVAVLAFGTVGDVRPLAALALRLSRDEPEAQVTFVTHQAHQEWLAGPLGEGEIRASWVASLPARRWNDRQAGKRKQRGEGTKQQQQQLGWVDEEEHRESCIRACEEALGLQVLPIVGGPGSAGGSGRAPLAALERSTSRLLVFNLFALEGFHIAEALGVPCVAASPCLVPYAMPSAYEQAFQRAHPKLYEALHREAPERPSCVSWDEVRHWMWPLFTERWGPWRYHRLGLPSVPYSEGCPRLPPPLPLLYGLSPTILHRPGYWPASVHLCGYWHSTDTFPTSQRSLPPQLSSLLLSHAGRLDVLQGGSPRPGVAVAPGSWPPAGLAPTGPAAATTSAAAAGKSVALRAPVCVDFGSMGSLGLIPSPSHLLWVLAGAARQLGRPFIILSGGWRGLEAASAALDPPSGDSGFELLTLLRSPVAHDVLLPHCAALFHHGGAGTAAAALRCGTPQLICPLHFDQHSWAERITWAGCGGQLPTSVLVPSGPLTLDSSASGVPNEQQSGPRGMAKAAAQEGWEGLAPAPAADEAPAAAAVAAAAPSQAIAAAEAGEGGPAAAVEAVAGVAALAAVLARLLQEGSPLRERCQEVQRALAEDDGTAAAVQHLLQYLRQYHQQLSSGPGAGWRGQQEGGGAGAEEGQLTGAEGWGPREHSIAPAEPAPAPFGDGDASRALHLPQGPRMCPHAVALPSLLRTGQQQQHQPQQRRQQEEPAPASNALLPLLLPNGMRVLCLSPSEALFIYREIFEERSYFRHGVHLPAGGVVVDVGANIGLFSLAAMLGVGGEGDGKGAWAPPACIWAFEPVPEIAGALRRNLEAHGLADAVHVVGSALHVSPGPLRLTFYPAMPGNSTAKPSEKWAHQRRHMMPAAAERAFRGTREVEASATTLAAFMAEQRLGAIDLLKVDVEGCELEVLQGMDTHCWDITRQLVLEVANVGGRPSEVQTLLQQRGFRVAVEQGGPGGNVMVFGCRA